MGGVLILDERRALLAEARLYCTERKGRHYVRIVSSALGAQCLQPCIGKEAIIAVKHIGIEGIWFTTRGILRRHDDERVRFELPVKEPCNIRTIVGVYVRFEEPCIARSCVPNDGGEEDA